MIVRSTPPCSHRRPDVTAGELTTSGRPKRLSDRRDIPQPGAYAHFHWLGATPMTMAKGDVEDGYLLELQAVASFCFVHHGGGGATGTCDDRGGIAVRPGIDIATHVNIVGSAPPSM